jgi:hypothetical protein
MDRDCDSITLDPPARYRPFRRGRYEVGPGLVPLGRDFGNGAADGRCVQVDADWRCYRAAKLRARRAGLTRWYGEGPRAGALREAAIARLIEILPREYPALFRWQPAPSGGELDCRLSGERLRFGAGFCLTGAEGAPLRPGYEGPLDALAAQIPEDLALVSVDAAGRDRLQAVHVCFPNGWAPDEKLGRDFAAVHAPVPHFERVARNAPRLLRAVADGGPYVRFVWGLTTDPNLSRYRSEDAHPLQEPDGEWLLRVERQVLLGLARGGGFLFLIRTYLEPVSGLCGSDRDVLADAIEGMDQASLRYKGLSGARAGLLEALRGPRPAPV